jgi:EAL domain-containing protein (putative c-di-GMP-specific phosphodiesterase class I)/ActR/RegA family two-component response regulator
MAKSERPSGAHPASSRGGSTRSSGPANPKGRVLIADDEVALLRVYKRALVGAGYAVDLANDGAQAIDLVRLSEYDAIVSDISMPEMDGLELLRAVRQHDLDVPVVLVTGDPALATAMRALEYGAFRYLPKPFDLEQLTSVVDGAVLVGRMAKLRRRALEMVGDPDKQIGDRAGLEAAFARAYSGMWMAFQPIVRCESRTVYGYEALLRSNEATLPHPGAILDAAARLGKQRVLGRAIRDAAGAAFKDAPDGAVLFVNLHPHDLNDDALLESDAPLTKLASRVVLEITERAAIEDVGDAIGRVAELRKMGFRIAIDDLGAGYAGLTAFAQLEPEVVKLDMSLVRDVHLQPTKRRLIRSMTELCIEMGRVVVAEGIETKEERDVLAELGCELMQGYLFARPGQGFPTVQW